MGKPKYRIVEEEDKFYPQERFLGVWWNLQSKYGFIAVFPTLRGATNFLDLLSTKYEKRNISKIVHPYNPKH